MIKKIIFLAGYPGCGRTTVGNILVKDYGYTKHSFSNRLKNIVNAKYTGSDGSVSQFAWAPKSTQATLPSIKDLNREAELWKYNYHNDIWAKLLIADISPTDDKIVITDLKYRNEYDAVNIHYPNKNVATWFIKRPGVNAASDPSENCQVNDFVFDAILNNAADIDALKASVRNSL